ncbi:MAG TPA: hypothetical protein VE666_04915, partial [Mycobacterium sp.]|nr:hypothetical protein [Mycobacterium sp.]
MENAKHTGYLWALAVAAGVGMAIINTPAVALATPDDNGKGSSGDSSSSGSSKHSSDTPETKRVSTATNDAPSGHRRPPKPRDDTAASNADATPAASSTARTTKRATAETLGLSARKPDGATVRRGSNSTTAEADVDATTVDPAASSRGGSGPVKADASTTQSAVAVTATPAGTVSRVVSNLLNAALTPFASSAPTDPVHPPAALMMLAFARRESEQRVSTPTTGQVTTSAMDPDFISSPHDFGLFSVT